MIGFCWELSNIFYFKFSLKVTIKFCTAKGHFFSQLPNTKVDTNLLYNSKHQLTKKLIQTECFKQLPLSKVFTVINPFCTKFPLSKTVSISVKYNKDSRSNSLDNLMTVVISKSIPHNSLNRVTYQMRGVKGYCWIRSKDILRRSSILEDYIDLRCCFYISTLPLLSLSSMKVKLLLLFSEMETFVRSISLMDYCVLSIRCIDCLKLKFRIE